VSITTDVTSHFKHAEGVGAVACPPTGDGIHCAGEEKEESEDGHRHAKEEEPEREMPTPAYMRGVV
jgi:hypothetical protein